MQILVLALCISTAASFSGIATTYGPPNGESPHGGNCALMSWLDFAPQFHVALNNDQYGSGGHCGRCVSVTCTDPRCTNKGTAVVGQITDRCPECKSGDLDMSLPMFQKITGFTTDRLQISWTFVDCPVQGGVQVCAKSGSSKDWLYVQPANTVGGVQSMKINGGDAPIFPSSFYYISTVLHTVELATTQVVMTSYSGETISTTVALTADKCTQIPQQFQGGSSQSESPPATEIPTTQVTTPAPTNPPTTTQPPKTTPPTTIAPTTPSPTTETLTTQAPTTTLPSTTSVPTTQAPTTQPFTTISPTTTVPTTFTPTTTTPTTTAPTTTATSTTTPTSTAPTSTAPTTIAPTTASPTSTAPTTTAPITTAPTTTAPTTTAPTTTAPTTTTPSTIPPRTTVPTTQAPSPRIMTTQPPSTTTQPPTTLTPTPPVTTVLTTQPVTSRPPTTNVPTTETPSTPPPPTTTHSVSTPTTSLRPTTTVPPTTPLLTTQAPTSVTPLSIDSPPTDAPTGHESNVPSRPPTTSTTASNQISVGAAGKTDASGGVIIGTIAFIAVGVGMYVAVVQRARRRLDEPKANARALSEIPVLETSSGQHSVAIL
ncbi:Aste57867_20535 [Aphanomyces stellatus]|uniref:Aste57867_20535 protein n=1 Tax=Aphanomyces stellatus TaxID=120398 RepID=A0A485LJX4_9STRA|nr:hypothetical protein As57867_020468 [Aphanomyces stellatus]VFT97220.1 Aste57867_20535 [Aphanomyces stellatus]